MAKAFLQSREGLRWIVILVFAAILSTAAAYGFYEASLRSFIADKTAEKGTALQLVEAFVDNYSNLRGDVGTGDAPVPSTFRAHSIEQFNRMHSAGDALRLRWIGREGRSIATPPSDTQMAATIESFVGQGEPRPVSQFVTAGGEEVFRTVYPSIAREQSCVDCHNQVQPDQHWQLNDVMGAFSLDAPVGAFLLGLRLECAALALAVFVLTGGVGLWISLGHYHRIVALTAAQAELRAREAELDRANGELAQTVSALQRNNQRFKDLTDVSVDWVWDTDMNHRFTQLVGHQNLQERGLLQGVIGKTRWEAVGADPETDAQWGQHKADVDAHRPFRRFRYEIEVSGGRVHVVVSGKPVFDDNGVFRGYRGTATDETVAVEALRRAEASEALLRDAIGTASEGFAIFDVADRLVVFSESYRKIYGKSSDNVVVGATFEEIMRAGLVAGQFPEAAGREEEWLAHRVCQHRAARDFEVQVSDGRWFLASRHRLTNGWLAALVVDISSLKAVQMALHDSEEMLRDAIGTIAGGFIIYDTEDRIVLRNEMSQQLAPEAAEFLQPGTPFADYLRHSVALGFFPEAVGREEAWIAQRITGHSNARDAVELQTRRGWLLITERRMSNGGIASVALDITQLKSAQAALRESEERLREAQRIGHMGSFFRNLLTDEADWSDECYRIFGLPRGDSAPTLADVVSMVHPDDRAAMMPSLEAIGAGESRPSQQYRIIRPDGSVRYLYRESEIVRDEAGSPRHMEGIILDITEFHKAQMRATELEQHLAQSQKMEAIGNLTGGMAHDFNNLLGIIIGNLDLLRILRKGDTQADELARDALDAATRGADLTRGLLAFARQQPLQTRKVDVNHLVLEITRLLARTLGEQVEITRNLAADAWPIITDPARLESSLANLATNARDAMPEGGRLTISTANRSLDAAYAAQHADAAAGDYVMIEVTDTGTGMTPEVVARVFEPFYTTKEFGRGTGLGLSMVFGFVKQSGGHIRVQSEPGAGTIFRLYLPRSSEDVAAADEIDSELSTSGQGETILVVEDNSFLRRVVVRQLTEAGYRVIEAENAAAGLENLEKQNIDLLFTDIVMPGGIDGVELARQVHEHKPTVKVVLTTGFSENRLDGGNEALVPGARLLRKPYRKAELAAAVRAALDL